MVADGRPYTAFSKIPNTIGKNLQILYPVTAVLNWLFAVPTGSGLNGFQITGRVIKLSVTKFLKPIQSERKLLLACQAY